MIYRFVTVVTAFICIPLIFVGVIANVAWPALKLGWAIATDIENGED